MVRYILQEDSHLAPGASIRTYLESKPFDVIFQWKYNKKIITAVPAAGKPRPTATNTSYTLSTADTFALKPGHQLKQGQQPPTVSLYVRCAGKTNSCVAQCGHLVPPCVRATPRFTGISEERKTCPSRCGFCFANLSQDPAHRLTCSCSDKAPLRPSHFNCKWRAKFVLSGPSLTIGKYYVSVENTKTHQSGDFSLASNPRLGLKSRLRKIPGVI